MARSTTQVPPDSTGDKLVMRAYPVGADTVNSQGVHFDGVPTYGLFIDNSAMAANKYHLYLRNDTGSNQTVYLTSLYIINLAITAITGALVRMDVRRVTGTPTLTTVTPFPFNSADPALAGVTAGTTVTAGLTDAQIIRPIILSTEEHTAVPANVQQLVDTINRLPAANDQERCYALRPGEAIAIRQPTAVTAGTLGFLLHFAVEPD